MVPDCFVEFLSRHEIAFAIVANLERGEVERFGETGEFQGYSLASTLFGDMDAISALNRSLTGQELPRLWGQGDVTCVVCKPVSTVIVGLMLKDSRDPVAQYQWSRGLSQEISDMWSDALCPSGKRA